MIPSGGFTPSPEVSDYEAPLDLPYQALTKTVWGGIALYDGSLGRRVRYWTVNYDGTDINVSPTGESSVFSLAQAEVDTVSMGFTGNMSPVLGWQSNTTSTIYFYNIDDFTTLSVTNTTSCLVFLDDPRDFNNVDSDVMFAYTKNNVLYYRQQRENYAVERTIGSTSNLLKKAGLNIGNRLQFELSNP